MKIPADPRTVDDVPILPGLVIHWKHRGEPIESGTVCTGTDGCVFLTDGAQYQGEILAVLTMTENGMYAPAYDRVYADKGLVPLG